MFQFIDTLNKPSPYYNTKLLYLYFHSKGIIIIVIEYSTTIIIIVCQISDPHFFPFLPPKPKSPLREVRLPDVDLVGGQ